MFIRRDVYSSQALYEQNLTPNLVNDSFVMIVLFEGQLTNRFVWFKLHESENTCNSHFDLIDKHISGDLNLSHECVQQFHLTRQLLVHYATLVVHWIVNLPKFFNILCFELQEIGHLTIKSLDEAIYFDKTYRSFNEIVGFLSQLLIQIIP